MPINEARDPLAACERAKAGKSGYQTMIREAEMQSRTLFYAMLLTLLCGAPSRARSRPPLVHHGRHALHHQRLRQAMMPGERARG
jgi:hypothetical protein